MAEYEGKRSEACSPSKRLDSDLTKGLSRKIAPSDYGNYMFGFHDREEIGPRMLAKIAKYTGLKPDDL
jgi:hypothetical protein